MLQLLLSLLGRCCAVAVVYTRRADFTDGQISQLGGFHSRADFSIGHRRAHFSIEQISQSGWISIWQISQLVGFQHRADFTVGRISASGGFYSRADFSIGQISQTGRFTVGLISQLGTGGHISASGRFHSREDFSIGRLHSRADFSIGQILQSGGFQHRSCALLRCFASALAEISARSRRSMNVLGVLMRRS